MDSALACGYCVSPSSFVIYSRSKDFVRYLKHILSILIKTNSVELSIQAIAIEIPPQIDFMSKYIGEEQISSTSAEKIYRLCAHVVS